MSRHGFRLLWHEEAEEGRRVFECLLALGWEPWDGNGLPAFVVLQATGTKQLWFEAGYLAGAGVPLFSVGRGHRFRRKHAETIGRLGGWARDLDEPGALAGAIAARGLTPPTGPRPSSSSTAPRPAHAAGDR